VPVPDPQHCQRAPPEVEVETRGEGLKRFR
jgi:hypothetical protein